MILHKRFTKRVALLAASTVMCMNVSVLEAKDYKGHWAQEAISEWVSLGIIEGYEDGSIRPSQSVTRAELATLLNRVFKLNYKDESISYKDVKEDTWYHEAVTLVMSAELMNDYEGEFRPNQMATREEAAYAFAHAYHLAGKEAKTFIDSDLISDWAKEEVEALIAGGYLQGRTDDTLAPKDTLTRAEFITMLDKLTAKLYQNPGTYTEHVSGNVVINTADITLKDMTISGNLYIAEGVGEGDVTLQNVKVDGHVIIEGGGEHSVEIMESDLNNIYVEKASGAVRVALDESSKAEKVKVNSKVQLEGNIQQLEVVTKEEVKLVGTTIKSLQISASAGNIQIDKTSEVGELIADAHANIVGNGKINKAFINADDVVIEGVKLAKDAIVISNDVKVSPIINTTSGQTSGGGGGGGSTTGSDKNESTESDKNEGAASDKDESTESDKNESEDSDGVEKPDDIIEAITLNYNEVDLVVGEGLQLLVDVKPAHATDQQMVWSSSNEKSVKVDQKGYMSAIEAGEAVITVTTLDEKHTATCLVTVKPSEEKPVISGIQIKGETAVEVEESTKLSVEVTVSPNVDKYKEVTWKLKEGSPQGTVVNNEGVLTAGTTTGTAIVVAICNEDPTQYAEHYVKIVKKVPVETIQLSHKDLEMLLGDETSLTADIFPLDATNKKLYWSSNNPDTVTVDQNGKITAKGVGEAEITASTPNGEVSTTCKVKVGGRTLSGRVTAEGSSLEGAKILLYSEQNQFKTPIKEVKTDSSGEYRFSDLSKGNYSLKVSYEDEKSECIPSIHAVTLEEAFKEVDIVCEKVTTFTVKAVEPGTDKGILYVYVAIEVKDKEGKVWHYRKQTDGAGKVKFTLPRDIDSKITYNLTKDGYEEITYSHNLNLLEKNTLKVPFKQGTNPTYDPMKQYADTEGTNALGVGDTTYAALQKAGWRVESDTILSTNSRRLIFENMNGENGIDAKIIYNRSGFESEIRHYDAVLQYMIRKQTDATKGDFTFDVLKQTIANGSGTHKDGHRTIEVTYDGKVDGIVEIVFSNYTQSSTGTK